MKKNLLNNFWLKLASLLGAIVLWMIVVNVENPVTTKQFSNVKVTVINENALNEVNKVYEIVEGDTVNFKIKGKRTIISNMKADDFRVTADMSKLSCVNSVIIDVEPLRNKDEVEVVPITSTLKVTIEDELTKNYPITINTKGDVVSGYAVGEKSATPNIVELSGPESVIKKIDTVNAEVDVDGASSDVNAESKLVYRNGDGDEIVNSGIHCSADSVATTVRILNTKQIAVNVDTVGSVAAGYTIANVNYEPKKIKVAGENKELTKIKEVNIKDVDVSNLTETMECSVKVNDYLPEGITTVEDNDSIMITVTVEPVETKKITLLNAEINLQGKREGYTYTIMGEHKNTISVYGAKSVIDSIVASKLLPTIDVANYGAGTFSFEVSLTPLEGMNATFNKKIEIQIKKAEE